MPQVINGFTLVEPPLKGGMAVVYKGEKGTFTRAFKFVRPDKAANAAKLSAHFIEEITLLSKLNHPNIVNILDAFSHTDEQQRTFTVLEMEWLNGLDLERYVEERAKKGLPPDEIKRIALQAIKGLAYAHQHNILHLDVKPSNLFRTRDGFIKIIDFGIARVIGKNAEIVEGAAKVTVLTQTGESTFKGTLAYASPEQQVGGKLGFASDIYSFGKTLHFLATGTTDPSAEITTPWLARIVDKSTKQNPKHRYQSFDELREDIEHPEEEGSKSKCVKCGKPIAPKQRFCGECGWDQQKRPEGDPQGTQCPNCGKLIHKGNRFCTNCGYDTQTPPPRPKKWLCRDCKKGWTDPACDDLTLHCCFCGSSNIVQRN